MIKSSFRKKHRKLKENIRKVQVSFLSLISPLKRALTKRTPGNGFSGKKVLILMLDDFIGDAVICTGLAKKLHDAGYQVSFLGGKSCKNLFRHTSFISEVFLYEKRTSPRQIEKQKFNIIIDLGNDTRFWRTWLIYKANADMAIGFNKSRYRMYTHSIHYENVDIHITERHKRVLALLGLPCSHYDYYLELSKSDEESVAKKLKEYEFNFLVALNPFTSAPEKDFSAEQVNAIVDFIKSNYLNVGIVLLGEYERISKIKRQDCIIFPESTISLAAAVLKRADFVITPDTSVVHISRVFNKKMLAVYNSGRLEVTGVMAWNMWLPNYENATVIRADTPCVSHFDPEKIVIKVEEILSAQPGVSFIKSVG